MGGSGCGKDGQSPFHTGGGGGTMAIEEKTIHYWLVYYRYPLEIKKGQSKEKEKETQPSEASVLPAVLVAASTSSPS